MTDNPMTDNPMRDLRLHCRCTGPRVSPMPDLAHDLGCWCGRLTDQEDGLCGRCRKDCARYPADTNVGVLTVPQVVTRDTPWLERRQADDAMGALT